MTCVCDKCGQLRDDSGYIDPSGFLCEGCRAGLYGPPSDRMAQDRLFEPAPEQMPGQLTLDA